MSLKSKKICVTGGLGYIGSNTVVSLMNNGYEVIILDNLSNSKLKRLEDIKKITGKEPIFYQADIRVIAQVEGIFRDNRDIGGVIHFAAKKAVGESCQYPFKYYSNNIKGTIHLLQTMDKYGVKNIIFSSSATVYDTQKNIPPFVETDSMASTSPYGTTKIVGEEMLSDISKFKQFNVVALRYFNPIGAHHSGSLGDEPNGTPNNLLPYLFKVASGELEKVRVFGDDYETKDGTGVRDYVHVQDVAEAHLRAYEHIPSLVRESNQGFFETFNVGTGEGTSVIEMIDLVNKVTGKKIAHEIQPRRNGDCAISIANVQKIERTIGRKAQRTIRQAVQDGRNFIEKNK